jgi:putative nucleotidyltransferase with HDIG domain
MPGLDGVELSRLALEEDPDLPIVILTTNGDVESATEVFRLGISDYLLKPPDLPQIEDTVSRALQRRAQKEFHREAEAWMRREVEIRAQEAEDKTRQLEEVTVGALTALVRILEARIPQFEGHSQAVSRLCKKMAEELGLPEEEVIACRDAGFLHDIGMIAIPDKLLEKPTGLTPEESKRVQEHCRTGAEILHQFSHLGPVSEYVLLHHERLDGSGYPEGLDGEEIPLGAQIVGAADSFCAITEDRPFRPGNTPTAALEILRGAEDLWYSPRIIDALERAVAGSLKTGRVPIPTSPDS